MSGENLPHKLVDRSDVRAGDTIFHRGHWRTVCPGDIRKCSFMGVTIFGDSFKLGLEKVRVRNFKSGANS